MYANHDKRPRDVERTQLLKRMEAVEVGGTRQEVADALAEAKRRLRNNYTGDNPIRAAQSRLLGKFPPTR
jgi:hypothetical protein